MSLEVTSLDDVSQFVRNGASIKQSTSAGGLPITRIETIADRTVNLDKCGYADIGEDEYVDYRLRAGDILISHINSEKHLGKCALFESSRSDIVHGMNLLCLRPDGHVIDSKYLFYYLSSNNFLRKLPKITKKSVNQASFTVTAFKGLGVPLPTLAEQKRIAAILDKADNLRRKRQQAIQLADEFLRAVFLDMFGDPIDNPKGWKVGPLGDGISSISAGWSAKGESSPCGSDGMGVLKISAVTSGVFKPNENKMVEVDAIPNDKKLIFPTKGDLLFSRANTRELVAATCIVTEDSRNTFLPDKLWRIRTDENQLCPVFLNLLLKQPRFKMLLTSQATGTSGSMLNISKAKLSESPAIFPGIDLQEKFRSIYWKTQSILKTIDVSASNMDVLFQSLSQKAFSGEL